MRAIYNRFSEMAHSRNVRPVIAFLPENGPSQTSGLVALEAVAEQQDLTFIDAGHDLEWSQFSLGPGCHPSPAGYRMMALKVARGVASLLAATSVRP